MANKEFQNVKITSSFSEANSRENLKSGETVGVLFGKIKKWFSDLKAVAFSGSYNDLSNKPVIPTKTSELTNDSGFKTTDTVYIHPTTSGNKHIPSGGSSGQILRWSADGTAVWGNDNDTTYTALKNPYALTLQFNGTTNKTYDGSSAQTFNITPSAIGAATDSHTHAILPSPLTLTAQNSSAEGGEIHLAASTSTLAGTTLDNNGGTFRIFGKPSSDGKTITGAGTPLIINPYSKTITGGYTFTGSLSGNASTATTLQTARTINGTSFNGSANITTANWGTARTITIGSTGKSVNGSENVSWTLNEIGTHKTWDSQIKCATWSRLCYIAYSINIVGCKFLLNIEHTRSNVVYNVLFAITAHHLSNGRIAKISGSVYGTNPTLRLLSDTHGNCYVEIYDDLHGATNTTNTSIKCTLIPIAIGELTKYTTFTSGESIPSGFNVAHTLKIDNSDFQGNLTGTASQVYSTLENSANGTSYYLPFHEEASSGSKSLFNNDGIRYWIREGTTSDSGTSELILGDKTPSGTGGNTKGMLGLYGTSSGCTEIVCGNNTTNNIVLTLPASSGTLALANHTHSYIPLSGSTDITGNLGIKSTNHGFYLIDSSGYQYPAAFDNGTNLWIGAAQQNGKHHTGGTYISAGHNGTSGNKTIWISIPSAENNSGASYEVLHTGTTSFTRSLSSGTKIGTIKINDVSTDIYAPTNTDTHYTTGLKVGASTTATANAAATNGNVYLNILDNTTVRDSHKIVGAGATTVTSDANGVITITSTNTNTTYSAGTGISLSGTTFSNSGVRSIASGSTNGTISVNTNGTTANIAVKGLGTAAYTASSDYAPASGSNNYVRVWNSSNVGNNQDASVNDLAKQHFAMAMVSNGTDNPLGAKKWVHVINMSWANGDNGNWVSQIALGVNDSNGMWYRTTQGAIVGASWKRVLDSSNYTSYTVTKTGSGASGTWGINVTGSSASCTGNAATATALTTSAGSATQPVYFSGGKPVACSYTLGKSVPSNAVFTDTNTWIAFKGATTSAAGTAGYAPAPAAGAANRYLRSDGTWAVPPDTNTTYTALKNPYALTVQFNGTTNKTYDGSSAQTFNITPSAIGAAASSHNHSTLTFTTLYGGSTSNAKYIGYTDSDGIKIYSQGNYISFADNGVNICGTSPSSAIITLGGRLISTPTYSNAISGSALLINSNGTIGKATSSRRFKTNINYDLDFENYHNVLMNLKSAEYEYNSKLGTTELGMIAEEVEELSTIAALYEYQPVYDEDGKFVEEEKTGQVENYKDRAIIQMLVMEAQRKDREIAELNNKINQLESSITG